MTEVCLDLSGEHFVEACRRQQQIVERGSQKPVSTVPALADALHGAIVPRTRGPKGEVFVPRGVDIDAFFAAQPK